MPGRLTGCNRWETRLTFWTRTGLAGVAYRGTACDTLRDATTGPAPSSCFCRGLTVRSSGNCRMHCAEAGARTLRVGFNRGDDAFWPDRQSYIAQTAPLSGWEGDRGRDHDVPRRHRPRGLRRHPPRPRHGDRAGAPPRHHRARVRGRLSAPLLGDLRTGAAPTANSPVMATSVDQMRRALGGVDMDLPDAPARWGALREHVFLRGRSTTASSSWRTGTTQRSGPIARSRCGRSSGSISSASRSWAGTGSTGWRRHGASCAAAIPIIWRCCNWSMTQAFATMAPSRHKRISSTPSSTASHRARPPHHHLRLQGASSGGRAHAATLGHSRRSADQHGIAPRVHFRAWRQARAAARRRAVGRHRQFHGRAAGALARSSTQVFRRGRLRQARVRLRPAARRVLPRPGTARQRRLPGIPALSFCRPRSFRAVSTPRAVGGRCCASSSTGCCAARTDTRS